MTAWLHAHVKVYETYKIEKYFYKYLQERKNVTPHTAIITFSTLFLKVFTNGLL